MLTEKVELNGYEGFRRSGTLPSIIWQSHYDALNKITFSYFHTDVYGYHYPSSETTVAKFTIKQKQ